MAKDDKYFSKDLPKYEKPMIPEMPASQKNLFRQTFIGLAIFILGVFVGISVSEQEPKKVKKELALLKTEVREQEETIDKLKRSAQYKKTAKVAQGQKIVPIPKATKALFVKTGEMQIKGLRRAKAQRGAELLAWFLDEWQSILEKPGNGDRTERRPAALSLFIGGMAENLNPEDYIRWQADFLNGNWLPEVHFDLDKDGYPAKRSYKNPLDSYSDKSVCHIAMALNQTIKNAQILVMPNMRCNRPEAKMSIFLQGKTLNDALNVFAQTAQELGFILVEKKSRGSRLFLLSAKPTSSAN
jgi:hypothetical protein